MPEIQTPTLVTGGRYDEARPDHLAVLAKGIRSAELVIFEDSSHMAFVEERGPYIQVVDDFLARSRSQPGSWLGPRLPRFANTGPG